jgi:hypothetical protein
MGNFQDITSSAPMFFLEKSDEITTSHALPRAILSAGGSGLNILAKYCCR